MARSRVRTQFKQVLARVVDQALQAAGLRREGRMTWWERRADGSWAVLTIRIDERCTTTTQMSFMYEAAAWPPGTWGWRRATEAWPDGSLPYAAGSSPIRQSEKPPGHWPWELDLSDDVDAMGPELRDGLERALGWVRQRSGVEGALATRGTFGGLSDLDAIVMLKAAAPDDPRLARSWTAARRAGGPIRGRSSCAPTSNGGGTRRASPRWTTCRKRDPEDGPLHHRARNLVLLPGRHDHDGCSAGLAAHQA